MAYVDGFVIPVAKKKIKQYTKLAALAGKVWMEHGALEYRECVADDLDAAFGVPFAKLVGLKKGETVVFSWIVYKNLQHRDRVNAAVMQDKRIDTLCKSGIPFDGRRMSYGGFQTVVDHVTKKSAAKKTAAKKPAKKAVKKKK
jgi:uncharacterized protein YbaA (DUF1428 family)